jgi:hypothetical protein
LRPRSADLGLRRPGSRGSALDSDRVAGDDERARQADEIEWVARRELCRHDVDHVSAMRTGSDRARERDAAFACFRRKDKRVVTPIGERAFERVVALIGHFQSMTRFARTVVDACARTARMLDLRA